MKMLPEGGERAASKASKYALPKKYSVKEKVKYKVKTGQKMPPLTPTLNHRNF